MADASEAASWADYELDGRLLKAILKLGWTAPTLVQQGAVPFALKGRDILAKARTGSGKTGAFAVPIVQRLLELKEARAPTPPSPFISPFASLSPAQLSPLII